MRSPAAGGQKAAVTCCHSAAVKASLWETGESDVRPTLFSKMIKFPRVSVGVETQDETIPRKKKTKVRPGLKTCFQLKGK